MNLPRRRALRTLALLSVLELLSVAALLMNLATLHLRPVTELLGPAHGAFFLGVAVTALLTRALLPRTRWMALIPVLGGVLTLVNVRIERAREPFDRVCHEAQG